MNFEWGWLLNIDIAICGILAGVLDVDQLERKLKKIILKIKLNFRKCYEVLS